MSNTEILSFVYTAMASGIVGNTTYDAVKVILGNNFDRLNSYLQNQQNSDFETALREILRSNVEIEDSLKKIASTPANNLTQYHSGAGDNIGRDKNILK